MVYKGEIMHSDNNQANQDLDLWCGKMSIYDTHIQLKGVDVLWEDVQEIKCRTISGYGNSFFNISVKILKDEKYIHSFSDFYFGDAISVQNFSSTFFSEKKKNYIIDFFEDLKKHHSDKKAVKDIDINQIKSMVIKFSNNTKSTRRFFIGLVALVIFFSISKSSFNSWENLQREQEIIHKQKVKFATIGSKYLCPSRGILGFSREDNSSIEYSYYCGLFNHWFKYHTEVSQINYNDKVQEDMKKGIYPQF